MGVEGNHFSLAGKVFQVRGATYGSFLPRADGHQYPDSATLDRDFSLMNSLGLNTVRLYTAPPPDLVDLAGKHDLRLIVGVDYRDWRYESGPSRTAHRRVFDAGRRALDTALEVCAGRPEILTISVGNEVPSDIARVYGIGKVEDVLSDLVDHVHAADPIVPVTYTNFATTEYLDVRNLDVLTFNIFLEDSQQFAAYLTHLHSHAGDRPLVITELGLASAVHGDLHQADILREQLRAIDLSGCAGATVFSFTDQWGVNGYPVEGWGFGITTEERAPKPAAAVVKDWATHSIKELREEWPSLSVVVCAYNEERTIGECLDALERCDYPSLEVTVCDDGSTDRTLEIARRYPFTIVKLDHGGLSAARNAGIERSSGEIVAFCDADAACHPLWPWYIAAAFDDAKVHAAGGPNLPCRDIGRIEHAVGLSPGSAREVLIGDDRAEHVPGCNMAFRREAIDAIGRFDVAYTTAGDDVDVCWKILDRGGEIAFAPGATVYHHRRATVRGYLRQQRGYGRAEKKLATAHPHRFNRIGQARWSGFIYGGVGLMPTWFRPVVYHGYQGTALYQKIDRRRADVAAAWIGALLPLVPALFAASLLAAVVWPWAFVGAAFSLCVPIAYSAMVAASVPARRLEERRWMRPLIGFLHVAQPFARAWGRLVGERGPEPSMTIGPWFGDRTAWLTDMQRLALARGLGIRIGDPTASWDLEIRRGGALRSRVTTAVTWNWDPHVRIRTTARPALWLILAGAVVAAATGGSILAGALIIAGGLATVLDLWRVRRAAHLIVSESLLTHMDLAADPAGT